MCGRLVWVWDGLLKQWVRQYDGQVEADAARLHVLKKNRYNCPPASHLPVITKADGTTKVEVARWGFPTNKRPNGVFNTRLETAAESPMWTRMLGRGHCIWMVTGFYEWKRINSRTKIPYYIHRKDGQPLLMAGLSQERQVQGQPKLCASILTCQPNDMMESIHDRMPAVLEPSQANEWLDASREEVFDLLGPADDVLQMHQVGANVGDTKNNHKGLMKPVNEVGLGAF